MQSMEIGCSSTATPRRILHADDFACFRDDIKPGLMRQVHAQLAPIDDTGGREVLDRRLPRPIAPDPQSIRRLQSSMSVSLEAAPIGSSTSLLMLGASGTLFTCVMPSETIFVSWTTDWLNDAYSTISRCTRLPCSSSFSRSLLKSSMRRSTSRVDCNRHLAQQIRELAGRLLARGIRMTNCSALLPHQLANISFDLGCLPLRASSRDFKILMLHPFPLLIVRQVASNKRIAACKYVRLGAANALIHAAFAYVRKRHIICLVRRACRRRNISETDRFENLEKTIPSRA